MMCDWCEKGKIIIDEYLTYRSVEIHIDKNLLKVCLDDGFRDETTDKPINFCPNCGHPLTEPKPLSLNELMAREGKPVYFKKVLIQNHVLSSGEWCLINSIDDNSIIVYDNDGGYYTLNSDRHNITWWLFDHEPHEVK